MKPEEFVAWRKRLAISQTDAAKRLGVSRPTVARWEAGGHPIPEVVEKHCGVTLTEEAVTVVLDHDDDGVVIELAPKAKRFDPSLEPRKYVALPFNTRTEPPAARWQIIPECGVICDATIPDPLPFTLKGFTGDYWAIISANGRAYHQITGRELRPLFSGKGPDAPRHEPGSRLKVTKGAK